MKIDIASLLDIHTRARTLDEELMRRKPGHIGEIQWRVENNPQLEETVIPVVDRIGQEFILVIHYQMAQPIVAVMSEDQPEPVVIIDLRKTDAAEDLADYSYDNRDVWAPMKALVRALNEPPRLQ